MNPSTDKTHTRDGEKVFYFLQGNSCSGSTGRLRRLGLNIVDSDYFGNVESIEEFIKYAIKEMQEKIAAGAKIVIVGSSFGGHLLLYLVVSLIRSNNIILKRIVGVVLTGTPPAGTPERIARAFLPPAETVEPGGRSVLQLLAAPDVMTEAEARRFVLPAFGPSTEYDHQLLIEENIKNVTTNINMGKTRHGILSSLSTNEFELAQIIIKRMKMLFIHAAKDPVINRTYVEEVARDLGAPLKVIDGYHYSHWSNAEEFADILTSFAVECSKCWCGGDHPAIEHNIENCTFCGPRGGLVGFKDGEVCEHKMENAAADMKKYNDFVNAFSCRW